MIKLPPKARCWKCGGRGYEIIVEGSKSGYKIDCDCEGGLRWDLGDLYRAVEDAGGIPSSLYDPVENMPDYTGEVLFAEGGFLAYGDTHEAAMVAVIAKVNEEAEDGKR